MKLIQDIFTLVKSIYYKIILIYFRDRLFKKAVEKHGYDDFIFQTTYGCKIVLNMKNVVDKYIYTNLFELDSINFLKSRIKQDSVFFDVGANVGIYSLMMSAFTNGKSKIHSFEPAESPFAQFERSIEVNNYKNIFINKLGVADKSGDVSFNICADNAYNSIGTSPMDQIVNQVTIPVISLDEYCQKNGIDKIDFLKIDTEGAEHLVFKGAHNILSSEHAPMIFAEYNKSVTNGFSNTANDIVVTLTNYDYVLFDLKFGLLRKFDPVKSNAGDIIGIKKNQLSVHSINI